MWWGISSQSLEIRVYSGPHSLGMALQTLIYQSFAFPSLGKLPSSPLGSAGKESGCNAGDVRSIPGLGISPGEGKGHPLQYSSLENSMDCIVQGVSKSQTRLNNFQIHIHFPL